MTHNGPLARARGYCRRLFRLRLDAFEPASERRVSLLGMLGRNVRRNVAVANARAVRSSVYPSIGMMSGIESRGRVKYPNAPAIVAFAHVGVSGDIEA